jgi:anti-sigma-K factor RskA
MIWLILPKIDGEIEKPGLFRNAIRFDHKIGGHMDINEIETVPIRKFLLHELDEDSAQAIEERFFTEPDFQELVLIVEEEIYEDYVLDILSPAERQRVEQFLLFSPEQKAKLASMAKMVDCIKQAPEYNSSAAVAAAARGLDDDSAVDNAPEPPVLTLTNEKNGSWLSGFWMRLATGMVIIIVVGLGIYLIRQRTSPAPGQLSKEQLERIEKINRENVEPGDDTLQARLEPMIRGDKNVSNQIRLAPGKKFVELNIETPSGNYKSYQATFREFDGVELATIKNLPVTTEARKSKLKVRLPADVLKVGVYGIDISGETNDDRLESIREFVFEVIR